MNNAVIRFPEGKRKVFTVSYDDGVIEDRRFIEILNNYGLKGTFNLNSNNLSCCRGRDKVSIDELNQTYHGHEIAVHTWSHPCPSETFMGNFAYEIIKDRELLEEYTGKIIRGMAYPMGSTYVNEDNVKTVQQCGIAYARTTTSTRKFDLPWNWIRWNPTCHHKDPDVLKLLNSFLQSDARLSSIMFYLWGHTYEFEDNNNWNLAEQIAKNVNNSEDIWYATNIQIYDYLTAARSLVCSAKGRILYNPTATIIWLESSGQISVIKPGETIVLKSSY